MDNIDIYNNSQIIENRKTPNFIISWITILIILMVILVVMFNIPFNIFKSYEGSINIINNKSYINLKLYKSDFPINTNNKLYIRDKEYNYKIIKINNKEIILYIKLEKNLKINNNIILINIKEDRTTVFKILKNKIKKGFGL